MAKLLQKTVLTIGYLIFGFVFEKTWQNTQYAGNTFPSQKIITIFFEYFVNFSHDFA